MGFEFVAKLAGKKCDLKALSDAFGRGDHTVLSTENGAYELKSSSFSAPSKAKEDFFCYEAMEIAQQKAYEILQSMSGLLWCARPNDFTGMVFIERITLLVDNEVVDHQDFPSILEERHITTIPDGLSMRLQRRLAVSLSEEKLAKAVATMAGPLRGWSQMYTAFEFMGGDASAKAAGFSQAEITAFRNNANNSRSISECARHGNEKDKIPEPLWQLINGHVFICKMIEAKIRCAAEARKRE